MALNRQLPRGFKPPSLKGAVIVDDYRGKLRLRAWPRKRGKKQTYKQKWFTSRFGEAARLAVFAPPEEYERAKELAHSTGLYPGDMIRSAMLGGSMEVEGTDGDVWKRYHAMVHPVTWQGARVLRASNLAISASTVTSVPWQTVELDTASIFDAGNPTRLVVPESVSVVSLAAGAFSQEVKAQDWLGWIAKNGNIRYAQNMNLMTGWRAVNMETGPIKVVEGDYFELQVFTDLARALTALDATFLSMTILQANP